MDGLLRGKLMNCENCKHYSSVNQFEGMCRHNAPAAGADTKAVWPVVLFDDACGQLIVL